MIRSMPTNFCSLLSGGADSSLPRAATNRTTYTFTQIDPQHARLGRFYYRYRHPQIADGLSLRLWASDSLVADPVAIDIDDQGRIYYIRTNRRKQSEFDIRAHQDWETASLKMQTVEDRRAFLRTTLTPEPATNTSGWPTLTTMAFTTGMILPSKRIRLPGRRHLRRRHRRPQSTRN